MSKESRYILQKGDCCELIKSLPDQSVDCVLTDPPYLYLDHKLDRPFDEQTLFAEMRRALKPDGMIAVFGRGESLYRWCSRLGQLGFVYKEDVIWSKRLITSPFSPLLRVHENCVIYGRGKGKIRKRRVPYLDKKQYDLDGVINDVHRIRQVLTKSETLKKVSHFLEDNDGQRRKLLEGGAYVCSYDRERAGGYALATPNEKGKRGRDRVIDAMAQMEFGAVEMDLIEEIPPHKGSIHPTQKPVRLLERLMALITDEGDVVLDPFAGSGSTIIAALNTGRKCIAYEIDDEYFDGAKERVNRYTAQSE